MNKSDISLMPTFFDRYIHLAEDLDIANSLETATSELYQFDLEKWAAIGDKVYAEGKWTVKQIIQHVIDTERIFSYRALCIARGETAQLPSFDENSYAEHANVEHRSLANLIAEWKTVRLSTQMLFEAFTDHMLLRASASYSVLAIGYIITGHQRWHFEVMQERYGSL